MTLLPDTDRARTVAQWMRDQAGTGVTKADLRAALNAADQWVEDNTTSYNTALPTAFRTAASVFQKTMLLAYVLMRRMGRLHAEEDG
jgi:hypothetical protein